MRVGAVATLVILGAGFLDTRIVQAQDPCAIVVAKAAETLGGPVGKPETVTPPKAIVCSVASPDRNAQLRLTQELGPDAQKGMMMRKMLASRVIDQDQKFAEEASLGTDAFSVRSPEQILFHLAIPGRVLSLALNRDGGVTDADVARTRALARALRAAK